MLFRALLAASLLLVSRAPSALSLQGEFVCRQSTQNNQSLSRTLANGASVTVRPVAANSLQQTCEVIVRDRNGKTVFEDRGFNTGIEPASGRDIDNDGQPDAVVGVDTIGGTPGSWEFPVISFAPSSRVLLKLPHAKFDFETKPGKTLIWTAASFENLSHGAADIPTVATVHEFRPSGFIDVTPDYCKALLSGELMGLGNLRAALRTLSRQAKLDSRTDAGRPENREDTRVAGTTVVLQQIYCGQFDEASRLVLEVWPSQEQSRVRKDIRDAIVDRWPDLAKRLGAWN